MTEPELPLLTVPADGIPDVVDSPAALHESAVALGQGQGPIAVDAERAQSFRYSSKAYLLQLRREGAGTHLVDPVALEDPDGNADLHELAEVMTPHEWVIHAASQDLPCLAMAGLVPQRIFDTELAGRLLGRPKVGLGALLEDEFGVRLLKEHSAANWSMRPIPHDWLAYAALDVELLVGLRDRLDEALVAAGKREWAEQEFEWQVRQFASPRPDDPERWRRTNGLHQVKHALAMALVRELWDERDLLAERYDLAPGKVVQDRAITELAALVDTQKLTLPGRAELRAIDGFKRRNARRFENNWIGAIDRVGQLSRREWPAVRLPSDGPPQPRSWEQRHPEAWARWQAIRPAANELAGQLELPPENLVQPDVLRRLAWQPPAEVSSESVDARLAELGARPWQREQLSALLAELLG
ncbi:HRDC domain-containing protein [Aestuariimicrobium ganziense]|uniref:HRDC domain-containing protein n=1 Tax=Aestuariimicrobium ganziense TaxID=2773677 RepID=UPI00194568C8|nr:HRDC domain-containing protein [Aestuariimicrobium ganziense]